MSHTILLVQPGARPETRTYSDYESVNECMEGVCKIYEEHLKRRNPNTPTITYDISQLFDFLDQVKKKLFCCSWSFTFNCFAGKFALISSKKSENGAITKCHMLCSIVAIIVKTALITSSHFVARY